MWTYTYTDELYHHGIKGQRWGVRRYQNKDGTLTPAGRKRQAKFANRHEDYNVAHDKKSVKEMSDKELRDRVNRLNMEKQYHSLSNETTTAGRAKVENALKIAGLVVSATGTAISIYNNISKIAGKIGGTYDTHQASKIQRIEDNLKF